MTQLILDTDGYNIVLPESRNGGYTAEKQPLSVDVEMVTGRMVKELRGNVWYITYQYGYLTDTEKNNFISACQKGQRQTINCGFLPPNSSGTLSYSGFLVVSFTYPKFMWSRMVGTDGNSAPVPMWGDFALELREVRPSD